MGESSGKLRDLGFALLSGILALAVGSFVLVAVKIFETANALATGEGGPPRSTHLVIFIASYAVAGFFYGRKRGFGFGRSLAAAAPILIMALLVLVVPAEQFELPWVIMGMLATILPPCMAHWLASYVGWKTVPVQRK